MLAMTAIRVILRVLAAAIIAVYALPRLKAVLFARPVSAGDASNGTVIFAESLRWLGVRWGRCETGAGLRRAGFGGDYEFWDWDPTWRAILILPTIAAPKFLERQGQRLAEKIIALRRTNPDRPIHLIGYSCGGFVAIRAMELLPEDVSVDSCAILAGAFSPWRDLNVAAERIRGKLVVCSSPLDAVVGLGTLIVGTADRVFSPSIGALGYRGRACEKVVPLTWQMAWIRLGHWGGHFTASSERFITECVAPAMGLNGTAKNY
jgi:hypothetical protein